MKRYFVNLIFLLFITLNVNAEENSVFHKDNMTLSGYVKNLSTLRFFNSGDFVFTDNIMNNRLKYAWYPGKSLSISIEARTRLISGETVRWVPDYKEYIKQDNGYLDLSFVPADGEGWLLHFNPDRVYINWQKDKWQIRAGRQRVNWGINILSNPNDLFNVYSFFDIDYEERPGTDALRVSHYYSALGRIELAASPAEDLTQSTAAIRWNFNRFRYDFQLIGGYYRERAAIGGGWAGHIATTGFKGEFTLFHDLELIEDTEPFNIVAAISADHVFSSGIFLMGEVLYNQKRKTAEPDPLFIIEPLSADNISFSEWSVFAQTGYAVSPVLNVSLANIYYPVERVVFLAPTLMYSAGENFDVAVLSQIFMGSSRSVLSEAGYLLGLNGKFSF